MINYEKECKSGVAAIRLQFELRAVYIEVSVDSESNALHCSLKVK